MLDEAARWARERGAHALHLYVLEGNAAAIGFYESRGWTFVAREPDNLAGIDLFALRYIALHTGARLNIGRAKSPLPKSNFIELGAR